MLHIVINSLNVYLRSETRVSCTSHINSVAISLSVISRWTAYR